MLVLQFQQHNVLFKQNKWTGLQDYYSDISTDLEVLLTRVVWITCTGIRC